jgi:hypothetical protein
MSTKQPLDRTASMPVNNATKSATKTSLSEIIIFSPIEFLKIEEF